MDINGHHQSPEMVPPVTTNNAQATDPSPPTEFENPLERLFTRSLTFAQQQPMRFVQLQNSNIEPMNGSNQWFCFPHMARFPAQQTQFVNPSFASSAQLPSPQAPLPAPPPQVSPQTFSAGSPMNSRPPSDYYNQHYIYHKTKQGNPPSGSNVASTSSEKNPLLGAYPPVPSIRPMFGIPVGTFPPVSLQNPQQFWPINSRGGVQQQQQQQQHPPPPSQKAATAQTDVRYLQEQAWNDKNERIVRQMKFKPEEFLQIHDKHFQNRQPQQQQQQCHSQSSSFGNHHPVRSHDHGGGIRKTHEQRNTTGRRAPPAAATGGQEFARNFTLIKNLDEKHAKNILAQFKYDLLNTEIGIKEIVGGYGFQTQNYLYTIILNYFAYLDQRMTKKDDSDDDITYIDLIDGREYPYEDFCTFGPRFDQFVEESNFFKDKQVEEFEVIGQRYRDKHPPDILDLRQEFVELKLALTNERRKARAIIKENVLNYNLVTFQKIEHRAMCRKVLEQQDFRKKFECFSAIYSLSDECRDRMMEFVQHLERILQSRLGRFHPVIYTFGSFSNGLATYNSDLDLFIKFRNINSDILDFHTSLLALEVIEQLMKHELNMNVKDQSTIIQSRRCPIIKLNFKNCFQHLAAQIPHQLRPSTEFSKCDISLVSIYGVYNSRLLNFLTRYDRRFYEMTMALKYWAKTNDLISQHTFSTYAFTMLIIFFLQQQQPPIIPAISKLQKLATQQDKDNNNLKVHKWNFKFCQDIQKIGQSKNQESTASLLVKFFKYYSRFNFFLYALSPRYGKMIHKKILYEEKKNHHLHHLFNMSSYFCIEDPFVLDHNVGYNFRSKRVHYFHECFTYMARKLDQKNCLDVLIDPHQLAPSTSDPEMYPPCNLFNYELVLENNQYRLKILERILNEDDLEEVWKILMRFFLHCMNRFLKYYLLMTDDNFKLKLSENENQLDCITTWVALEKIFTSKHWKLLRAFINSAYNVKIANNLEKLKTFRNKFKKDLQDHVVQKYGDPRANKQFRWFTLGYKISEHGWAHFYLDAKDKRTFPLLDLITSIIQMFLHAIERANPEESFDQLYRSFF